MSETKEARDYTPMEKAVGNLYVQYYTLRQTGKYQEEYDAMGTLMDMLAKDRAHIRKTYGVKI